MQEKIYYSVMEVAVALGVHRNTVIYWINHKFLKAHKPHKKYFIVNAELKHFLEPGVYETLFGKDKGGG